MEEDLQEEKTDESEGIETRGGNSQPPIGLGERLIIYPLLFIVDILEIGGNLIEASGVGLVISFFISAASLAITTCVQFYLSMKHIKNYAFLLTGIAGAFPIIGGLFFQTVGFAVTDFMTSNKKVARVASKIPSPTGNVKNLPPL